ncbi:bifunctional UDP-N-acetylglucosamine diphosphorylase/glucosamine-1-phosphate N-acetyltransferase GlmU [Cellvibrio japonicus]|uniref:Bifunctional protein GlmU n=1 Tax=Cellvibrio japonicus (strain Ueda107) TaxID=498211 RepID=GLMU_CELJU|nr:bifunctional UDP-N-acetylglucosamine diphosphorylase/glucosamine-1-phosphate N-acetyltransferase GlmU [Cellvibrio japonicus]B3PIS4.1 RecName: Full=Bifunctional protein GlmU; Includes: RecName: Full=UDP-N-acetylglucosamine pyrophosphorylase; AltName: Full=N-acetylglucosamine-1-phosphate uridyltransferase; Includes: RecName: Full=Glucosamine-1-phosphate N-acetyltransferase [Cellvibrio japonicus Ueda107]ACE83029.1 UDP-N-acetylglucosamine pyrophosphorylase [Cellvibrio japonicus Ueda107]QEI13986.1
MLDILILAAGKGTRMRSDLPKVLHPIGGKPLVQHVVDTARQVGGEQLLLIVGHGAEQVEQRMAAPDVKFVVQAQQLGTGHAVQQALPHLRPEATVLILYGDVPLTRAATLQKLVAGVTDQQMALLTVDLPDPSGYGRIVRDTSGAVVAIVEHKDASDEQRLICEINTGIMAVKARHLQQWLPRLGNNNAQGEYYLTDIIAMAKADGVAIHVEQPGAIQEVEGINNRQQQATLERYYQQQQARALMDAGVTLLDPARFDCRGNLSAGRDVVIDINCVIEGEVVLGDGVVIEPNCIIINSKIGNNTHIKAFSHIEDAVIAADCDIGPYARLRPGTNLADAVKIGNFVETKKAVIAKGSKVNHLSYIGDARVGSGVNVGAGTITCNYDGVNKFKTEIGDNAFIGSNSALVAPVNIGAGATVGAGSVITRDVDAAELAVARGKQRNIQGWERPTRKS